MTMQAMQDINQAKRFAAEIEARAQVLETPCGGGSLLWRRWGDASLPPLVLLHGGFGSWRHWILNIDALAERYTVYCCDLPGLGDSADLPGEYRPQAIAEVVWTGMEQLFQDEKASLTGFSFGGIIGSYVAAHAGDRLAAYVGVAPGGLGLALQTFPQLLKPTSDMSDDELNRVHRQNLRALMLSQDHRVDALAVYLQRETVRRARARSGDIPRSDATVKALKRCICPVAGIWGAEDVLAKGNLHLREAVFRNAQPDCDFRIIDRAGHWVMYDEPAAFNSTLLDVLAQLGDEAG